MIRLPPGLLALLGVTVGLAGPVRCESPSRDENAARVASVATAADDSAMEQRLADAARYLSSDELEGRGLGTRGIELAAEFIAEQFKQIGLKTDACQGTPFQPFQVATGAEPGPDNKLTLVGPKTAATGKAARTLKLGRDFTPLAVSASLPFDLPLVFAGYGITDRAAGYDDYANLDASGKAVIILRHEPYQADKDKSRAAKTVCGTNLRRKISNAYEHGAAAVIFCTDNAGLHTGQSPEEPLLKFVTAGLRCAHLDLPVVHCRRAVVQAAIQAVYGQDLAAVESQIARGPTPLGRELTGWRIAGRASVRTRLSEAKNVVAVLPGAGPNAQETIVVGAHYDHFGCVETVVDGRKQRDIYSGADDNASGVSAMIEIARYLAHRGRPPARQVVFVSFCAEEAGLLGSSHYVCHPVAPLSQTVAMINLDMVGRLRDNKLYVRGSFTASGWAQLLADLDQRHGLTLDLWQGRFGSSDQLSFFAKEVPILHFFTGRHEDYHEPTDKFEKLNIPGMRRVTRMAEDVVAALADAPSRPAYVAAVPPEEREPYFGAFGDFTRPEPGYALGPVAKGGPAQRAGLRDGDLIVQFDGGRIASVDDFNEALAHHVDGERVRVVAKRGSKSRTFDVTLGAAK